LAKAVFYASYDCAHIDSAISSVVYQVCMAVLFSLAQSFALDVHCLLQSVGELILSLV